MKYKSLDHLLPEAQEGYTEALNAMASELSKYLNEIFIPDYYFHGYGKEDLIQDTILIVIKNVKRIKSGLKSYSYTTLKNLVGDNIRRKFGRKAWDEAQRKPIINEFGEIEDKNLPPIITELDFDPGFNTSEDAIQSVTLEMVFSKLSKIKDFCKLYVKAIVEDSVDKLYELYHSLNPTKARATYYVDLNRCRKSIRAILSREDLI